MAYRSLKDALEDFGKRLVSVERQLSRARRGGGTSGFVALGSRSLSVDLPAEAAMTVSDVGAPHWSASELTFSRSSNVVFVNGTLRRVEASTGPVNAMSLGHITDPYWPSSKYGENGGPYPGSVSIPAVGMNGADCLIPAVVRIRADGHIDAMTSAPVQSIQLSGSYRASD